MQTKRSPFADRRHRVIYAFSGDGTISSALIAEESIEMDVRMRDASYQTAVTQSGLLQALADFDPHVVGTLPLDIAVDGSDIDIACFAPDPVAFTAVVWTAFASFERFSIHQWVGSDRPVVASFRISGWDMEIFGARLPVKEQPAWRHFDIEKRLLDLAGPGLRSAVLQFRLSGMKTEPSFAMALNLGGNAYDALLELQTLSDCALALMVRSQTLALPGVGSDREPDDVDLRDGHRVCN